MRLSLLSVLFFLCIIVTGCSDNEETKKNIAPSKDEPKQEEKKEAQESESDSGPQKQDFSESKSFQDLQQVPEDQVDIINQLPGVFAGKEVFSDEMVPKVSEYVEDVPSLPENPTEEEYNQYVQYVFSLAADDFPDPNDLVKKWEFSMYGSPELKDSKYQFKDNYNVEIILDSSGSMNALVGDKTQMDLAKEAIDEFVSNLPEGVNISLRVYGHKGTGSEADKSKSCSGIEQVYGFDQYDSAAFDKAINQFKPSGWTPIGESLKQSFQSFEKYDGKTNTNLIYLVSDGIETCDGDPVKVAKDFADSNVSPIINVIGFNVDSSAQKQLKEVAESSNGIYSTVTNKEQLTAEFDRAEEVMKRWESWKNDALRDADAQRVDNSFDILGFSNDWKFTQRSQYLRMVNILSILQDQEKLSSEQKDELRNRMKELSGLYEESIEEILANLESMNKKQIEDLKSEIKKKYNNEVD
ncbi:VWA domain-containing protein [Rossellomorea marisflavi]|uniref:VWA domain-containing protein n=1 Tax=Rossellomorea marisflavi TaxID=189381 RepID=UPI001EE2A834|nr:VWA domain-containing protein [Rossellomorea marisflavi]UKS64955.1 VWA domain-containing protein [Rossellomorea marisflavi]